MTVGSATEGLEPGLLQHVVDGVLIAENFPHQEAERFGQRPDVVVVAPRPAHGAPCIQFRRRRIDVRESLKFPVEGREQRP